MAERDVTALLIVDAQKDFCRGGALPVPDGDAVMPVLNRLADQMHRQGAPVYASRDWHPRDTTHFRTHGGAWPIHCVAETEGALFHPDLRLPPDVQIVSKGLESDANGYSAFEGRLVDGRSFLDDLRDCGVGRLLVGGLATDYCVRQSVLDALGAGFEVIVIRDAVRGVDVTAGDSARAMSEMKAAGARFADSSEVLA